jgi:tetratricopeptide (TPR) repeat protein
MDCELSKSLRVTAILFCIILLGTVMLMPPAFARPQSDLDNVMEVADLQILARSIADEYYGELTLQEKNLVDREVGRLSIEETFLEQVATELTSVAAVVAGMGASEAIAIILSAEVVAAKPYDALGVSNFGAILHLLDRLEESVAVLRFALVLEPDSPVILTNLANSTYDLGDARLAEELYLHAIAVNPVYAPARRALGDLYLVAGHWSRALEHYLAAAEYGFTPGVGRGMQGAADGVVGDEGSSLPPPPGTSAVPSGNSTGFAPGSSSGERNGLSIFEVGKQPHSLSQVTIPNMPEWDGYVSLALSYEQLGMLSRNVASTLMELATNGARSGSGTTGMGVIAYDKQRAQLAYLERYYAAQIDALSQGHGGGLFSSYTGSALGSMGDELQKIADQALEQIMAIAMAGGSEAEIQEVMIKWCEHQDAVHGEYYTRWLGRAKQYYSGLRLLLEMYIQDSAPILRSIYDKDIFRMADIDRQIFILTQINDVVTGWAGAPLYFMNCLSTPCNHTGEPEDAEPVKAEGSRPPQCPFEGGGKLKIDIGFLAMTIDCTTVGLDGGELILGGFDWNFKERRIAAVRLGMGFGAGGGAYLEDAGRQGALGKKTGLAAGGSMGLGMEITFDRAGGVSDIRGNWDMGGQLTTPKGGLSPAVSLVASTSGEGDVSFGR